MWPRSTTTDVSIRPCERRDSATRSDALIDVPVEVLTEPAGVDRGRMSEGVHHDVASDEATAAQREQLADWHPVAGDDERFALVESAHDLTTVVAQFSLGDRFGHSPTVARVRHRRTSLRRRRRLRRETHGAPAWHRNHVRLE